MNILDFIFPKYCVNCKKFGDFLCSDCFSRLSFDTKNICLACGKPTYNGLTHPGCIRKYDIEGSFTALVYGPIVKKMIFQFKYEPHLTSLKSLLGDLFYESLIQYEEFSKILKHPKSTSFSEAAQVQDDKSELILVPIPLSSKKLRKRGYNQAEILAKELSKKFGLKVIDCLERVKDTKTQVGLNKKERQENIKGAFRIKSKYSANFKNSRVILVDDVLTTGSTFSEAASVLKHSNVRQVWAVALAKED